MPCLNLSTVCITSAVAINVNTWLLHEMLINIEPINNTWYQWWLSCFLRTYGFVDTFTVLLFLNYYLISGRLTGMCIATSIYQPTETNFVQDMAWSRCHQWRVLIAFFSLRGVRTTSSIWRSSGQHIRWYCGVTKSGLELSWAPSSTSIVHRFLIYFVRNKHVIRQCILFNMIVIIIWNQPLIIRKRSDKLSPLSHSYRNIGIRNRM